MSEIKIKRVQDNRYELVIDGSIVETYNQTKMTHPWDWSQDATDNGVNMAQIRSRNFDYIDDR